MIDKQVIDKLKKDVACKENIINHLAEHNIKLQHQLKAKEQECEQEKTLKEMYFTYYKAKHEDVKGNLFRYKQALAEIKELAKDMNKECFYNDFDCKDCDMKNGCTYQGKMKILQIINEVEDEI